MLVLEGGSLDGLAIERIKEYLSSNTYSLLDNPCNLYIRRQLKKDFKINIQLPITLIKIIKIKKCKRRISLRGRRILRKGTVAPFTEPSWGLPGGSPLEREGRAGGFVGGRFFYIVFFVLELATFGE